MTSWTNPTPGQGGISPSQANFRVAAPDIGSLVAAIMRSKQINQEQANQNTQQLYAGIAKGVTGAYGQYEQSQDSGQIADYLNFKREADASGTPASAEDLTAAMSSMSPSARAKMAAYEMGNQPPEIYQGPNGEVIYGKGGSYKSIHEGSYGYDGSGHGRLYSEELGGYVTPAQADAARRSRLTQVEHEAARYGVNDQTGSGDQIDPSVYQNPQSPNIHGPTSTPTFFPYAGHQAATAPSQMQTIPEGQYLIVDPNSGKQSYVTKDFLEGARAATKTLEEQRARVLNPADSAPAQYGGFGQGGGLNDKIEEIKAAYKSGKIDRTEAAKQIRALGVNFTGE